MRRANTAAAEEPPRRGARGAASAAASAAAETREYSVSSRLSRRMLSREIGVLMLILAAQTIMGVTNMDNALGKEVMAESESFHGRPSLNNKNYAYSSSYYSSAEKELPYMEVSDGMSSSGTSPDASESCDDDRDEEEVAAARLASRLTTPRRVNQRFAQDEDVWENIFSLLPWEAATQARALSKYHFGDALAHVTIARMPQSKVAAVFIPCLEDLDGDEMAVEAELAPQLASADAPLSGGQRLFLGQLRRTGTVPMVRWLVNKVFNAPPGALVSVENRRNTRTQRGKGCAWATINDAATVERMLGAHHRLFFDTVEGVEGVWLVPEGHEDALQTEVSLRNDGSAHAKHMPRGTIVVEIPESCAVKAKDVATADYGVVEGSSGDTTSACVEAPTLDTFTSASAEEAVAVKEEETARVSEETEEVKLPVCKASRFVPYRVPGADFVRQGVYRHNPYTVVV